MNPEHVEVEQEVSKMCRTNIPGFDYRTSTGIGLKHQPPCEVTYEKSSFNAMKFQHKVNQVVKNDTFKTCYSNDFAWKFNDSDPTDRANNVAGTKLMFIKPYAEILRAKPPNPPRTAVTEYKKQFPGHTDTIPKGQLVDLAPKYYCKIVNLEKNAQMASYTEGQGAIQHLDPYNSKTHLVHHNIERQESEFYRSQPIDISTILSPRIRPVYDKCVLRLPFLNKIVHTPLRFVPHTGLKSETKSSFRLPLDELVTYNDGVEFPATPHRASKAEVLMVPGMYHTEYSHLNNAWPTNAVVNQSNQEISIIVCEPISQNDVTNIKDCFERK